jgi:hypothetical protein
VSLPEATTIGDSAFYGTALTSVRLPEATTIGDSAFYGTALTSVSLPEATTIGNHAFYGTALTSVSLPKATTIGDSAFYGCAVLISVSIPKARSIGDDIDGDYGVDVDSDTRYPDVLFYRGAFAGCTALASVNLPAATYIGQYTFADCTALESVSFPATLTTISGNPFIGCTKLTTITVADANPNYKGENGMLLDKTGTTLIEYPAATGNVTLNTVTTIGAYAFRDCAALESVSLPVAASIGDGAFQGCTALTEVSLGTVAPTLGYGMFHYINTAKTVTVRVPSGATGYGDVPATYSGTGNTTNWGNGFRGRGWIWTGTGFFSGYSEINTNITLNIVEEE